jgi:hypothetical protein
VSLLALEGSPVANLREKRIVRESESGGGPTGRARAAPGAESLTSPISLSSQLRGTSGDAEIAGLFTAAERALAGVISTSDEGELLEEATP